MIVLSRVGIATCKEISEATADQEETLGAALQGTMLAQHK
jgi:hypothetical protein